MSVKAVKATPLKIKANLKIYFCFLLTLFETEIHRSEQAALFRSDSVINRKYLN